MLWRALDIDGMALPTFGQISMLAWEYYSLMMLADEALDFLLLCNDGKWKLREWSTQSYPSWHCNRLTKDTDSELTKGESIIMNWYITFIMNMPRSGLQLHPTQQWCKNERSVHRK